VENVLAHGVGGLNIDATRIGTTKDVPASRSKNKGTRTQGVYGTDPEGSSGFDPNVGRWPANVMLDEEAAGMLDAQVGERKSGMMKAGQQRKQTKGGGGYHGNFPDEATAKDTYGDSGGASRFFYCPKASKSERGPDNKHPTVKPLALMRWLIQLVTPPGGIVVDPFCGSGSTLVAAVQENFDSLGIDIDAAYCAMARQRLKEHL
jgi:site-specific DNA-methyltransferase (adenine-specific)